MRNKTHQIRNRNRSKVTENYNSKNSTFSVIIKISWPLHEDLLMLPVWPPEHGHHGAPVEGAAGQEGTETVLAQATLRLQAGGGHETLAQREPGAHHAVGRGAWSPG